MYILSDYCQINFKAEANAFKIFAFYRYSAGFVVDNVVCFYTLKYLKLKVIKAFCYAVCSMFFTALALKPK
jgi:hypothetical protein